MPKWTIPDYITSVRFITTPVLLYFILKGQLSYAFILYVITVFTDAIDGVVAGFLNQRTEYGGMLDALADRFFLVTTTLGLLFTGLIANKVLIFALGLYVILELVGGIWITRKYKKSYLSAMHRNSIRYTAVLIFIIIGIIILNSEILLAYIQNLSILLIFFMLYTFYDYVKFMNSHKKMN